MQRRWQQAKCPHCEDDAAKVGKKSAWKNEKMGKIGEKWVENGVNK